MCQGDWQWHQFGGVVASVTEHESLVAGADIFAFVGIVVDTHCNVRALPIEGNHDVTGAAVDTPFVVGVSDSDDGIAHDVSIVDDGFGCDFANDQR